MRAAARIVRLGGDSYIFALLAMGSIDLVLESHLQVWDIDPIVPVIENAGGRLTDWQGRRLGRNGGQVAAAGDQRCLDEALASLRPAAD